MAATGGGAVTKAQLDWVFIAGIAIAMSAYIAVNLWGWL